MTALLPLGSLACGPRRPALVPVPEPAATGAELRARHEPAEPRLTLFRWRYHGREGSFGGEGALRLDPEGRARVDLLGSNSATVEIAILRGDSLFLASQDPEVRLPPPAFLWAMAGVFRPPPGSPQSARAGEGVTVLEYRRPEAPGVLRFEFGNGRLRRLELLHGGGVRQELALTWPEGPGSMEVPIAAEFRDRREFRRIRLEVVESRAHAPFDSTLFAPRGG